MEFGVQLKGLTQNTVRAISQREEERMGMDTDCGGGDVVKDGGGSYGGPLGHQELMVLMTSRGKRWCIWPHVS